MTFNIILSIFLTYYIINLDIAKKSLPNYNSNKIIYYIITFGLLYYIILKHFFGSVSEYFALTQYSSEKSQLQDNKFYLVGTLKSGITNTVTPSQYGGIDCKEFPATVYQLQNPINSKCGTTTNPIDASSASADPISTNVDANYNVNTTKIVSGLVLKDTIPSANLSLLLNLGNTTKWNDTSYNSNIFDLYGSPTYLNGIYTFSPSKQNYALLNTAFSPIPSSSMTIAMWVKPSTIGTTFPLFSMNRNSTNNANVGMVAINPSGKVLFFDYDGTNFGYTTTVSNTTVSTTAWQFITFVKSPTSPTVATVAPAGTVSYGTYYYNGNADGVIYSPRNIAYGSATYAIGVNYRDMVAVNTPQYFDGQIGHVFLYNDDLTQAQIQQIYTATKAQYGL